jgi:hypothetical protein
MSHSTKPYNDRRSESSSFTVKAPHRSTPMPDEEERRKRAQELETTVTRRDLEKLKIMIMVNICNLI